MLRAVIRFAWGCLLLCALAAGGGCETRLPRFARPPGGVDAGFDAGADAGADAGPDAGADAGDAAASPAPP